MVAVGDFTTGSVVFAFRTLAIALDFLLVLFLLNIAMLRANSDFASFSFVFTILDGFTPNLAVRSGVKRAGDFLAGLEEGLARAS